MDSSEIVKKRLIDLKKLSQELKDSTEKDEALNLNIIKAIIDITKDNSSNKSPSLSRFLSEQSQFELAESPKLRSSQKKLSSQVFSKHLDLKKIPTKEDEREFQPLFPDNNRVGKQSIYSSNFFQMNSSKNNNSQRNSLIGSPSKQRYPRVSSHSQYSHVDQDQMIQLRQENAELQIKLRQMQEQLNKYMQKDEQEINGMKVPRFNLEDELNIFLTRLNVSDDDYQRVEYHGSRVRLTLHKIVVEKKRSKNYKNSQFLFKQKLRDDPDRYALQSSPQLMIDYEQLPLKELHEVEYVDDHTMLLVFIDSSNIKANLFIQFDDSQQLQQWDLGIYINFKIIQSLHKEKLFLSQKNQKVEQRAIRRQDTQEEQDQDDEDSQTDKEKQLLLKYLSHKEKLVGLHKKLSQTWIGKIQEAKTKRMQSKENLKEQSPNERESHKTNERKPSEDGSGKYFVEQSFSKDPPAVRVSQKSQEGTPSILPPPSLQKYQTLNENSHDEASFNKKKNIQEKYQTANQVDQIVEDEHQRGSKVHQRSSKDNANIERDSKHHSSHHEEDKKQDPTFILQEKPDQDKHKIAEEEAERHKQKIKMMEQEEALRIETKKKEKLFQAFKSLKKGIFMIKYAKNAINPHEKKVFLNQEETELCWSDKGSQQRKFVPLSQIVSLQKGEIGPGIQKHEQKEKIKKNKNFYFTIHLNNKDRKLLQFGIRNQMFIDEFIENLELVKKAKSEG